MASIAAKPARLLPVLLLILTLVLLFPQRSEAYAGPGAGFAVLSSFWTIFVAFLYSFYALVTWPIRQLLRMFRRRKAYGKAQVKRVVIVGFDGMDPELASRFMSEGKLPNLAKLRDSGTFRPLRTTFPAISPVAWSTFQTGVNPGKHNIYDFLARDLKNYLPYLSSAQISEPKRHLKIGKYSLPLGKSEVKGLRKGTPFWHWLGKAGVFCSVIRVPVTFPPEKFPGVLLSGMCVPDLKGSQGTFCFCTTRASSDKFREGGVRIPVERNGAGFHSYIPGPENPLGTGSDLRADFKIRPDVGRGQARIEIESETFTIKVGEYSEWIPVKFKAGMGFTARGICRFYLKEISPEVEVYVTPVNIDPGHPDLPISHPVTYSIYLAKLFGPYATLGLAEDTWALNEEVLDDQAFLAQCYGNHEDRERMFFDALEKTPQGLCACVFDTTDRVQHMFWRYLDKDHPAVRDVPQDQKPRVIQDLYDRMDTLIGRVMQQIDDQTLLLVISDHGFQSFNRCMNLNAWLHQNGYLVFERRQERKWRLVRRRGLVAHPRLHHGPERPLYEHQRPRARRHRRSRSGSGGPKRRTARQARRPGRSGFGQSWHHRHVRLRCRLRRPLCRQRPRPDRRLRRRLPRVMGFGHGQSDHRNFRRQPQSLERRSLC